MNRLRSVFSRDPCQKYYNLTRVLGKGAFASVKLATRKSDGTKWAVKIIHKGSLSQEDEAALQTEVEILQAMDHPNIVKLQDVFDSQQYFYMVMELCTGGELFDRIVTKDHYTENEARACIKDLVMAVAYCHQQGIVHRDLKPENLLYGDFDEGNGVLKLADFGLAKLLSSDAMLTTACGTPGYVAPEILEGRPYGKEVDMWSVGVIAYILLCGFPPFYDESNTDMFNSIKAGKYDFPSPFWDEVDPGAKNMVDCLLVLDPKKRYSAEQLLEHPWMSQGPTEAGDHDLSHFKRSMRAYNARRKFKATIMTVQMMNVLGKNWAPIESQPDGGQGAEGRMPSGEAQAADLIKASERATDAEGTAVVPNLDPSATNEKNEKTSAPVDPAAAEAGAPLLYQETNASENRRDGRS